MRISVALVLAGFVLAGCATYSPPKTSPTIRGMELSLGGKGGAYNLHALASYRTYPTMQVKADGKKLSVETRPYGTMVTAGGRNLISEQLAVQDKCFVLVDSEQRAVPVWPKSYGGDIFAFSMRAAGDTVRARQDVIQAESSYSSAVRAETAARNNVTSAQTRLNASPIYRNNACNPLQPAYIPQPYNVMTPAQAADRAEAVIQEAMAARYGCSVAGRMLTSMGKRPEWEGFVAGFACGYALTPKTYPKDDFTMFADAFEDQMVGCFANEKNDVVTRSVCGVVLLGTAGTRYSEDVRKLTARNRAPYDQWQASVQREKSRVDGINSTCSSALATVRNGPSAIKAAQQTVAARLASMNTAQAKQRSLMAATNTGQALRCLF